MIPVQTMLILWVPVLIPSLFWVITVERRLTKIQTELHHLNEGVKTCLRLLEIPTP